MTKNLNGFAVIAVVALLVVLGAVGFVKAIDGSPTYIIENIEQADFTIEVASLGDFEDSMNLGASGTRFPNGISTDSTSPSAGEMRGTTLTLTGAATFSGDVTMSNDVTLSATTTLGQRVYKPIRLDLGLSATTTAEATTMVLGHWCNVAGSPVDIDISSWKLYLSGAAVNFGTGALTIGSTTVTTITSDWALGTNSFTGDAGTSTATFASLSLASSTTGWFDMLGVEDNIYNPVGTNHATTTLGTDYYTQGGLLYNTSTPRTLNAGGCVVIGWNIGGATSSNSLLTGGGELIDGYFYMDAWAH